MAFSGLDYYAVDELYSQDERLIRDTVRELVSWRVMPTIQVENDFLINPDLKKLSEAVKAASVSR